MFSLQFGEKSDGIGASVLQIYVASPLCDHVSLLQFLARDGNSFDG